MTNIENVKNVTLILGTFVGVFTLVKAFFEYKFQLRQKRAEFFLGIRNDFLKDPKHQVIRQLLYNPDKNERRKLIEISRVDRAEFADFFENVALLTYSGLIRFTVSCHSFSWYAIECWDSECFWNSIERNNGDWDLLKRYVKEMKLRRSKCSESCMKCDMKV
jgi:hypothetical protein